MIRPVRLRLSRKAGFDLQALSLAYNGRAAVNVTRPGKLGNPFSVHPTHRPGRRWGGVAGDTFSVPTVKDAVLCFREIFSKEGETADAMRALLPLIRGKNVACWCHVESPWCHGDVWLDLANKEDAP